jgi:LytS/YehU family sensor histidine kinase
LDLRTHPEKPGDKEYLEWATVRLSRFLEAGIKPAGPDLAERLDSARLHAPAFVASLAECRDLPEARECEVVLPLRLPAGGFRYYLLLRRPGGRPYLSEDLAAAARLAEQISEHVAHYRDLEMKRLVAAAELRALQAQIHPHFLFNALNTLYGVIPREASVARRAVLNLADIWRYFLRTDRTYIPLAEELEIIEAYLEVEKLRLGSRLRTVIEADAEARNAKIPVLCVQPLVENAVRHGVARSPEGGEVRVTARLEGAQLSVAVSDTGPGFPREDRRHGPPGVGLENVARRLQLCYGEEYRLEVHSRPGETAVGFKVPVRVAAEVRL